MSLQKSLVRLLLCVIAAPLFCGAVSAAPLPMRLDVDATEATRRIIHVHLEAPSAPGPVTLNYPSWGPGEHAQMGRVTQLGSIFFHAGGKAVPWRRDLVDANAFHLVVPEGATSVTADFDYLLPVPGTTSASSSARLLVLRWALVLLYVTGTPVHDVPVDATLKLPEGWQFGTALPVEGQRGSTVRFKTASLETIVDSPVIAGAFFRRVQLAGEDGVTQEMDLAADSEHALSISPEMIAHYKDVIAQAGVMFQAHHFRDYHFLVALSDYTLGGGIEHHESSDDRVPEAFFVDPEISEAGGYFLPHEYAHSWNGKFRRPAGLSTPDYQQPMKTDLLWVYEGLTGYLGNILASRSGLWSQEQAREYWASMAASMEVRTGRQWRPLQDTADTVPVTMKDLFSTPPGWTSWLRSMDYYDDGALMWLEADTILLEQTGGRRSLDDFYKIFHGGGTGAPEVKPYTEQDVYAALNQVAPYDWAGFFRERLTTLSPHAPIGGFERGGWRLSYTSQPNSYMKAAAHRSGALDLSLSLGLSANREGTVSDVIQGAPASRAGMVPGMKITSVNERHWSPELLTQTVADSASTKDPLTLDVEFAGFQQSLVIPYHGGLRYPHLERISGQPDLLTTIFTARSLATTH